MVAARGRILKSQHVIIDGRYHLDVEKTEVAEANPQETKSISAPTQVCVLQNHADYAVLEVTCTCGKRMCLRCEYGGVQTPDQSQTQNGTAVEPNEKEMNGDKSHAK